MIQKNKILENNNQILNKSGKNRLNISPTRYFITQPSSFLTTPKIKKDKLPPKNVSPKKLLFTKKTFNQNKIINNVNTSRFQAPTKITKKPKIIHKKVLILDIDETLVHSAFTPFNRPSDIILNIKFNGLNRTIYVLKRPYIDEFLKELSDTFEIITFTASLSQYADPLLDKLDKGYIIKLRLFRENCIFHKGIFIKDLRKIGKELKDIIIIDNNPASYLVNIDNGLPILTWYDNLKDNELMKLIPLLKYLSNVEDVRPVIRKVVDRKFNKIDFNIVNQIIKGDNNILKGNNEEKILTNREINYNMITKKITNSLSNMSYNEYIKIQDNKTKNKENINLDNKQKNIINENSTINKVNSNKTKLIQKTKNINEKRGIRYNTEKLEKINNENISHNNNENKINIINNNIKNNINLTIINNYINNNEKNFINTNMKNYIKLIKNKEINNRNNNNYNKVSFNNYMAKNLNISDMISINSITPKNFPEDNKYKNDNYHPFNSGAPQDSNSKKINNNIKFQSLIKYNTIENSFDAKNINNSLPNSITINNVNFNNQMYINNNLISKTPKKENKNYQNESKQGLETTRLKGKQRYIKNFDVDNIINKDILNDKLKKLKNLTIINNNINKIFQKKSHELNNKNSKEENNIINESNIQYNQNIVINNNEYIISKNKNNLINNKILNHKINLTKSANKNNPSILIMNNRSSNQFVRPKKKLTKEDLPNNRASSPTPFVYGQINGNYKYYYKPNNIIKNKNLNHYANYGNKKEFLNISQNNYNPEGSIDILYRNNIFNMSNYNKSEYLSNINLYNNYVFNSENSYLYNN